MTESALQIPHLTQTFGGWLAMSMFAARTSGSHEHLESREQRERVRVGRWGPGGGGGLPGKGGNRMARKPRKMSEEHIVVRSRGRPAGSRMQMVWIVRFCC